MSTETQTSTPDTNQKQISITFDNNGALNYSFSNGLSLAEIIGSLVVVGTGLMSKAIPNDVVNAIYEKVSQLPVINSSEQHFNMPHVHLSATNDLSNNLSSLQEEWNSFKNRNH